MGARQYVDSHHLWEGLGSNLD
ncbi:uncharacterized protein G2W53_031631 [Senna tora]|uniref:Uncharacterized protein n=1 Tax=Senna tora TaxID=362788 RepID=A0A834T9M6_9FABA|nr:uncharacterized protein G2W53_031631 [Senna tora]